MKHSYTYNLQREQFPDDIPGGYWNTKEQVEAWNNRPERKLQVLQDKYSNLQKENKELQNQLTLQKELIDSFGEMFECSENMSSLLITTTANYKLKEQFYKVRKNISEKINSYKEKYK